MNNKIEPGSKIKILVVEDDSAKLGAIVRVIKAVPGVDKSCIVDVRDAVSAKKQIERTAFDLLILDIRIPTRIEDAASSDAGLLLLSEIIRRSKYKRPLQIIGITAYDDSEALAKPEFSEHLWGLLRYDSTTDLWEQQLRNKLEHLISSKQLLRHSDGETYEMDLAIITALDGLEFAAVRDLDGDWEKYSVPNDDTVFRVGNFERGGRRLSVVAAAAPRMGMAASAVLAAKVIHNFRPRVLCMCGIAAGVRGKTNFGDILAPDPSWDWGSGKREKAKDGQSRFFPDPHQLSLESGLRAKLRAYAEDDALLAHIRAKWPARKPENTLRLHVGPVASGAAVLADPDVVESIREQQRKLIGIEMEVYGLMTAAEGCSRPKPLVFALKSVSDFGDEDKDDEMQSYAAYTSAAFMYEFCLKEFARSDDQED